ncbi:MAG: fibronectin type III domain-containing protein [Bdellovibrionia bacterium]
MKAIISILVLALTLTLSYESLAAGGGHDALTEEMNKLFPPHKPELNKRVPPGTVTLVAPKYFEKISADTVELKWNAVEGADMYHVQVATDANFKWLVNNEYSVTGTSYNVTGLEKGKQYYWRVLSFNSQNEQLFTKSPFKTSMFQTQ